MVLFWCSTPTLTPKPWQQRWGSPTASTWFADTLLRRWRHWLARPGERRHSTPDPIPGTLVIKCATELQIPQPRRTFDTVFPSVNVLQGCSQVSLQPRHYAPSHVLCRADAKQECERLGLGMLPTLLPQNSLGRPPNTTGRNNDDEGSLRRRARAKVRQHRSRTGNFDQLPLSFQLQIYSFSFIAL